MTSVDLSKAIDTSFELRERLGNKLIEEYKSGQIYLNFNGHFGFEKGNVPYDNIGRLQRCLDILFGMESSALSCVGFDLISNNITVDDFLSNPVNAIETISKEDKKLTIGYSIDCSECGERLKTTYDGRKIYIESECEFVGGMKPWSFTVNVPSGKLIFRNDMRKLFPEVETHMKSKGYVSINNKKGMRLWEESYAKHGLVLVHVDNTCPSVYDMPSGNVHVGNHMDYEKEVDLYEEYERGSICTDLWAFSACDYDDFIKRGGVVEEEWPKDVVIDLKDGAGKYKVTCNYHTTDLKDYAIIEKVSNG